MKRKNFYQPTQSERGGAPTALIYELNMFHFSVRLCEFFRYPCSTLLNSNIRNLALEGALLHARNLLDFFIGVQPMVGNLDEDSIRAGYFVGKNSWWTSSKLPCLKDRKKDINKSLTHLTYSRIKSKQSYQWNIQEIKKEIDDAYAEFLKLLPEKERGRWQIN